MLPTLSNSLKLTASKSTAGIIRSQMERSVTHRLKAMATTIYAQSKKVNGAVKVRQNGSSSCLTKIDGVRNLSAPSLHEVMR